MKDKNFFIILIIVSILLIPIAYTSKSNYIVLISVIIPLLSVTLLSMHLGRKYKVKLFQFLLGDFTLQDTESVNRFLYRRSERWVYDTYRNVSGVVVVLLIGLLANIGLQSLIIPGISLISVGIALSIVTFNYSRVFDIRDVDNFILSSAKRFYLASIFAIGLLILIFGYKFIPTTNFIFIPFPFMATYLEFLLKGYFIIWMGFFLTNTLRYLLEGFILSLKETIIFDK